MAEKFANTKYEIDMIETGKRLKAFRKSMRVTIAEVSDRTGLSRGMISETETGKNKPSPNLMLGMHLEWGLNIHWLLTGEGDRQWEPGAGKKKKFTKEEFSDLHTQLQWYMENVPMVRYALLGFFSEYMFKHKDRIDAHLVEKPWED